MAGAQGGQPLILRGVNGLGTALDELGLALADLDENALFDAAERRTGLHDFDGRFHEAMRVLLASIERDANLNFVGRVVARGIIVRALANRLRFVAAREQRREALDAPVRRPIVVVAMPRTGSTLLHRLLCEDPRALYLPLWLMMHPMPPPSASEWAQGGGARARRARVEMALQRLIAPRVLVRHEIAADLPEEDTFLFMSSFVSLEYWAVFPVYRYARWLMEQPAQPAYGWFREHLQLLQADLPGDHWVLKSPMHFAALGALLDVFPEARVVLLHRHPRQAIPSSHSLFDAIHAAVSRDPQTARMVAFNTGALADAADRIVDLRDGPDAHRIHDVRYDDLVGDPAGTVRGIYDRFDEPWPDGFDDRLQAYLARNPKGKHGKHTYSLADFGQTEAEIDQRFSRYIERFCQGRSA